MGTSLPDRLRRWATGRETIGTAALLREAADAIDMLLAQMATLVDQRERLRSALAETQTSLRETKDLLDLSLDMPDMGEPGER